MELNLEHLTELKQYLPSFDVAKMQQQAKTRPRWIHIGPGNIFRVFLARLAHEMLADGIFWPVTAVAPMDPQELEIQLEQHDLMTLGVTLNPDGSRSLQVVAGIGEGLAPRRSEDFQRLVEIAKNPEVSLVSFTITEKGYGLYDSNGNLQEEVAKEITQNPEDYHRHTMVLVAGLLYHRFVTNAAPITLLSADNFSHNGDKLRDSILQIVSAWLELEKVPSEFADWVSDETKVAFPISVIDKITPRPNPMIAEKLMDLGFSDMNIQMYVNTPLAGFVNTEPTEYLIVEDKFAGERPPFEKYGVHLVDRQTCDDFENMKVTTCLNPLHTALAISGMLLQFETIDSEMRDQTLKKLVMRLGENEGLPVVVDPQIVDPKDFLQEVLEVRFPNRYLPDLPSRIAMDTSQKIPIRFGETIKKYQKQNLDLSSLEMVPLVFALWARYLLGKDDQGDSLVLASDPLLEELTAQIGKLNLGEKNREKIHQVLQPIYGNPQIFGVNLYETPLAQKAENLFAKMIAGVGAVRSTLDEELQ